MKKMIHYITGNIFESRADALVNTVNTVGVMGKGLALQFRETFPENYKLYKNVCKSGHFDVGQLLVTEESNPAGERKTIVNFPTKRHWRYPSEYSFIEIGLKRLREEIEARGIKSIAIPPLGSHNGGLEWQRVKPMIETMLSGLDCDVFIYEPTKEIAEIMRTERVGLTPARALLLYMFSEMNKFGEFVSVFAAEKIVYFLQRFGAKSIFKTEFKPYFYGPYSGGRIVHLLYSLNGSYIKGMTSMEAKPFDYLWLTENASEDARRYIATYKDDSLKQLVEQASRFLEPFYSNYSLELLSSVDYLLENSPSLKGWQHWSDDDVLDVLGRELQNWSARKGKLFKREWQKTALIHLRESHINKVIVGMSE